MDETGEVANELRKVLDPDGDHDLVDVLQPFEMKYQDDPEGFRRAVINCLSSGLREYGP